MGGGSSQPATTTQISKVQLPKWVSEASKSNYGFAQDIAAKPLVQYGGPTVAAPGALSTQGWDMLAGGANAGADSFGAASDLFKGVGAAGPSYVTPGMLKDTDLSAYMNPYIDQVENRALDALGRTTTSQLQGNASKALASKSFGGSRGAIVDAVTRGESARAAGDLSAGLRKSGFDTAAGLATADINRGLQGALANQGEDQSLRQGQLAAAGGLGGLGANEISGLLQKFAGMSAGGKEQQAGSQALLDADKAKFDEAQGYDLERLNILLSSLGMSPYGKTQSTTGTQTAAQAGPDWASAGLGALSLLSSFSDRKAKTDITKLGKDPDSGIDMYAYRYKDDPKTYPKVVGPMAQDIEKVAPHMVRKIGGMRVIRHG